MKNSKVKQEKTPSNSIQYSILCTALCYMQKVNKALNHQTEIIFLNHFFEFLTIYRVA